MNNAFLLCKSGGRKSFEKSSEVMRIVYLGSYSILVNYIFLKITFVKDTRFDKS